MKLLCVADGFGDSKIMPSWYPDFYKWPEIINLMTRGVELTNVSRYGAGNEYIAQCVREHYQSAHTVLVQWAIPNRLDLILNDPDDFWDAEIALDPVYRENVVVLGNHRYWITSASQNPHVRAYHQKYIKHQQHQLRSQMFVEHVTLLLTSAGINHGFLLTWNSDYLQQTVKDTTSWYWHDPFQGMHSFRYRSKFASIDFGMTQPCSLVQFDFIKQFVMPRLALPWRNQKEIDAVENMLYRKHMTAVENKKNDTNKKSHS